MSVVYARVLRADLQAAAKASRQSASAPSQAPTAHPSTEEETSELRLGAAQPHANVTTASAALTVASIEHEHTHAATKFAGFVIGGECDDLGAPFALNPSIRCLLGHPTSGVGLGLMHHLPRLCGSNKSLPSSLNPSHPKTTSRAFVPRRRTTSAVAPMTYAQHTRPYERIPERQSSWGGGLPAGVNPPTASPSINTCLMHTDRSDGMPTTKEALTSACCSQHRIICCCLR